MRRISILALTAMAIVGVSAPLRADDDRMIFKFDQPEKVTKKSNQQLPPELLVRPAMLGPAFDVSLPVFGEIGRPRVFGSPDGHAVVTWDEPSDRAAAHLAYIDPAGRLAYRRTEPAPGPGLLPPFFAPVAPGGQSALLMPWQAISDQLAFFSYAPFGGAEYRTDSFKSDEKGALRVHAAGAYGKDKFVFVVSRNLLPESGRWQWILYFVDHRGREAFQPVPFADLHNPIGAGPDDPQIADVDVGPDGRIYVAFSVPQPGTTAGAHRAKIGYGVFEMGKGWVVRPQEIRNRSIATRWGVQISAGVDGFAVAWSEADKSYDTSSPEQRAIAPDVIQQVSLGGKAIGTPWTAYAQRDALMAMDDMGLGIDGRFVLGGTAVVPDLERPVVYNRYAGIGITAGAEVRAFAKFTRLDDAEATNSDATQIARVGQDRWLAVWRYRNAGRPPFNSVVRARFFSLESSAAVTLATGAQPESMPEAATSITRLPGIRRSEICSADASPAATCWRELNRHAVEPAQELTRLKNLAQHMYRWMDGQADPAEYEAWQDELRASSMNLGVAGQAAADAALEQIRKANGGKSVDWKQVPALANLWNMMTVEAIASPGYATWLTGGEHQVGNGVTVLSRQARANVAVAASMSAGVADAPAGYDPGEPEMTWHLDLVAGPPDSVWTVRIDTRALAMPALVDPTVFVRDGAGAWSPVTATWDSRIAQIEIPLPAEVFVGVRSKARATLPREDLGSGGLCSVAATGQGSAETWALMLVLLAASRFARRRRPGTKSK